MRECELALPRRLVILLDMSQTRKAPVARVRYHPAAYEFVDLALKFTQRRLGKGAEPRATETTPTAHISGPQLLDGIRELALKEFGLMTIPVLRHWGIANTEDFGRIVWDLIERGQLSKTDRDQMSDFSDVYDFESAFDRDYQFAIPAAFRS